MNPEEELKKALDDEADRHEVDVQSLYVATRARLTSAVGDERADRSRSRRVLGAAAAVAAVAVTVALLPTALDRVVEREDSTAAAGAVDEAFSCPVRRTTRFTASNDDDSFLPELTVDGEPAGEASVAPRYDVVRRGDIAELRLGNADGTLASVVTFRRSDGEYERVSVTKCSNAEAAGATSAPQPLVTPGLVPGPSDFAAGDFPPGAARVVDRLTYDTSGLEKRQSIWAHPCGERLCLVSGSRTSTQMTSRLRGDGTPYDLTSQLSDPDDVVGIDPAQRLFAIYDTTGRSSSVSWTDRSGGTHPVPAADGAWSGRLFLVLVPSRSFDRLDVVTADAGPTSYSLADIRG